MNTTTVDATVDNAVSFSGDRLAVRFASFRVEDYRLFLKCKKLPESEITFDPEDESYTVTAPARFAKLLGVEAPRPAAPDLPLSDFLFDDQSEIVKLALAAKRFACWSGCGLGKTLIFLEWSRHVIHRTGGRVLIVSLNEVVPQTVEECRRFYGDSLPIRRITSREEMRRWCKEGGKGATGEDDGVRLAITNYEKWNPESLDRQIVSEAKHLCGVVLDESSRLRGSGGKQKWALIKSCKGIEYKLACTATPAPNDTIEFCSQASFLEKMRNEGEIIWTYFARDPKSHRWAVKPHAREAFFRFMSSWSIYVRDPRKYGWRLDHPDIPPPVIIPHEIDPTPEQLAALAETLAADDGQGLLPGMGRETNAVERSRLSQIAKGFRYRRPAKEPGRNGKAGAGGRILGGRTGGKAGDKEAGARVFDRIPSRKPALVAALTKAEADAGLQVLVWTVFDAESTILAESLRAAGFTSFDLLTGKTAEGERLRILERFRRGESRVLVSRATMLGYGMNFQFCGSMVFSGFNDSYEQWFQAVRRAYRYGQTKRVRVHVPVVKELEEDMYANLLRKQALHESSIDEMEQNYVEALKPLRV